jgi:hypothetical protein
MPLCPKCNKQPLQPGETLCPYCANKSTNFWVKLGMVGTGLATVLGAVAVALKKSQNRNKE